MGQGVAETKGNRVENRKTEREAERIYRLSEREGARDRERREYSAHRARDTTRDRKTRKQTGSKRRKRIVRKPLEQSVRQR